MKHHKHRRIRKGRGDRRMLTPEQRAEWARERRALEGNLIVQEGFVGAVVVRHIRGSQYLIRIADGSEVYASHKKQTDPSTGIVKAGWKLWEDRS